MAQMHPGQGGDGRRWPRLPPGIDVKQSRPHRARATEVAHDLRPQDTNGRRCGVSPHVSRVRLAQQRAEPIGADGQVWIVQALQEGGLGQIRPPQKIGPTGSRCLLPAECGDYGAISADPDPARAENAPPPEYQPPARNRERGDTPQLVALTPGTRLGVYQITAQIGEGGMGAVYRATDTSLSRQVAIKVLPDAFAADPERLARFEREAKTLASLNHPHIAAIYAVEKSGPSTLSAGSGQAGTLALVMELVEGDDLSQRIARGAIPLDEALPIAKQIARHWKRRTSRGSSIAT